MKLIATRIEPTSLGRVRLVGTVSYDDRPTATEEYWYEVDEELSDSLSRTGNPWLVCLAPLASKLGEPIRLCLPVDRLLRRNVAEAAAIWRSWFPDMRPLEVDAETIDGLPETAGERSCSFFTCGVDSFFTALRSTEAGAIPIDELVTVAGFDIPFRHMDAYWRRVERCRHIAPELGKRVVAVVANLRRTRLGTVDWGALWHGAGLASVGLALERRYGRLVIGSTFDYRQLQPLGSHPMVDPLHSSSGTAVIHDGAAFHRAQKIEYLSRSDLALQNLHVCFRAGSDVNCGTCEKCYRTMAVLEVLGRLSEATSFPVRRLDLDRLSRVFVWKKSLEKYYRAIRALALSKGRRDVVRAVDRTLRRSLWRRQAMRFPNWISTKRGVWRAAGPMRRALRAGEIV